MKRLNSGWSLVVSAASVAALGAAVAITASLAPGRAVASAGPQPLPQVRDCLYGISKDACQGRLSGDQQYETGCDSAPIACRTYHLDNAAWEFPLVSSNLRCATNQYHHSGLCDEFQDRTDGRFISTVSVALRLQETCRFRGTITGRGTYYMADGSEYSGRIIGVIGAGADRVPACTAISPRSCESCLDTQFIDSVDPGTWKFGVEVIFEGTRVDQPTGDRVRLNITGDLVTQGDLNGPFRLHSYDFVGTADGVLTHVCQ
jgi:hypothetical protein